MATTDEFEGFANRRHWPFVPHKSEKKGDAPPSKEAVQVGRQAALWRRRPDDLRDDDRDDIRDTIVADIRDDIRDDIRSSIRAIPSMVGVRPNDEGRRTVTLGWHPDIPDLRDKSVFKGHSAERWSKVREAARGTTKHLEVSTRGVPFRHDNIRWCSPVEDQGPLGSCTAQAVVGLIEFMQRRGGGDYTDGSRLFLYKVARNLLGWTGDSGAYIRTALKAAVTFGVPPERFWPYDIARFEEEPTAFLYSYAQDFQALNYARLDDTGVTPDALLKKVLETIASGLGIAFGFTVYSSITNAPDIPIPTRSDTAQGGHAVMAVGYDDAHVLPNGTPSPSLIIRNSWGPSWGIGGYGFLPYEYILQGLSCDFWTILKTEWRKIEKDAE